MVLTMAPYAKTSKKWPFLVREVMILGAGASEPYGTPPFGEFVSAAQRVLKPEEFPYWITEIWRALYRGLTLEELYTLLTFQIELGIELQIDLQSDLSEELRASLRGTPYVSGGKLDFNRIREDLYYVIPVVIFAATQESRASVYGSIVNHAVHTQKSAFGTGIDKYRAFEFISFNWDTLLENQIRAAGYFPHYFPGESSSGKLRISVLKPHGSLETVVCQNAACPQSKLAWPQRMARGKEVYGNRNWIADYCTECDKPTRLILMPPHFVKAAPEQGQRWSHFVFKQMYAAVKNATRLTIVGYSLPATDYNFRLAFRMAIAGRKNLKEISVVTRPKKDPARKEEFERNYVNLLTSAGFPEQDIHFNYDGVESWSKQLVG